MPVAPDSEDDPLTDGRATSTTDRSPLRVLPFTLQETQYCVDATAVTNALGISLTGSLENVTDPWNAGEITLEDECTCIRVVDVARVFSSPTAPIDRGENPKLLVFERTDDAGRHYGWLVDDVSVVKTTDRTRLSPPRSSTRFVHGRLELEGAVFVWLDEQALNE